MSKSKKKSKHQTGVKNDTGIEVEFGKLVSSSSSASCLPFGKMLHPLAEFVPAMSDEEFGELVADVKANGLRDPITLTHDRKFVVDGRHRLQACFAAGVKHPTFERLPKNASIAAFIISKLIHRNLTASQRAAIAAELMSELKGRNGVKNDTEKGKTREKAAKALHVSEGYVHEAAKLKQEDPEKFKDVKAGKLKLSKARPKKATPKKAKKSEQDILDDVQADYDRQVAALERKHQESADDEDADGEQERITAWTNDAVKTAKHLADLLTKISMRGGEPNGHDLLLLWGWMLTAGDAWNAITAHGALSESEARQAVAELEPVAAS